MLRQSAIGVDEPTMRTALPPDDDLIGANRAIERHVQELSEASAAVQSATQCAGCGVLSMPGADGRCPNCGNPLA